MTKTVLLEVLGVELRGSDALAQGPGSSRVRAARIRLSARLARRSGDTTSACQRPTILTADRIARGSNMRSLPPIQQHYSSRFTSREHSSCNAMHAAAAPSRPKARTEKRQNAKVSCRIGAIENTTPSGSSR